MNTNVSAAGELPAERLLKTSRPLVIGHRGYCSFAPENTLPSFKLALAAGVDLVELDYYLSKDGVPVVIHDGTLDRTTDAVAKWGQPKIPVGSKTVEELKSLDAGNWFDAKYAGVRIPLLAEALDCIQSNGVTLIERKGGDAAACVRFLRERGLINRVIVQSFDWAFLADFHQEEPAQVLGALGPPATVAGRKLTRPEQVLDSRWIDGAIKNGAKVVGWNHLVTKEAVDYAARRGLKVWVYTVNDTVMANDLLDRNIHGIITDNPSIIWRTLALRGGK